MEQQPPATEMLCEEIIMPAVSVRAVADDGMKDVFQVAPDLMHTPCQRRRAYQ